MNKFCTQCGSKRLADTEKFCAECGTAFSSSSVPPPVAVRLHPDPSLGRREETHTNVVDGGVAVATAEVEMATGAEAEQLYEECVAAIGQLPEGQEKVNQFKSHCGAFGKRKMQVSEYHSSMLVLLGRELLVTLLPKLVRLIRNADQRQQLIFYHQHFLTDGQRISDASSTGSCEGGRSSLSSSDKVNPEAKKGVLNSRYADHPQCDICNITFEVTKRRHQCRKCGQYICSSCAPLKLLIPPGQQIQDAKKYDPSVPQVVCILCAPQLHDLQPELVKTYGKYDMVNSHEAKGRLHVPYSSSLEKECRNAADILGNFFRPQWGATTDRSIPIALLEKAHGIALMTIVKAGFLITGRIGTGLVVAKLDNGEWSAPSAIGTVGLGGGFEIGGELVELMIILGSPGAVKVFHKPQVNVGGGLDLAVGPYGRSAEAAAAVSKGGLNANYSYSMSKGLYAGISLQGTVIATRKDVNAKFYGRADLEPKSILGGEIEQPKAAQPIYDAIRNARSNMEIEQKRVEDRINKMPPCHVCQCSRFVQHTKQVWNRKCKTCDHIH